LGAPKSWESGPRKPDLRAPAIPLEHYCQFG
jgi:hypothetical protein